MNKRYMPTSKKELFRLLDNPAVNLAEINTSRITDMSELFLHSVRSDFTGIESWNTENVTSMRAMFYGAENFNVNINDWNTKNVLDMQYMFKDARAFNQPLNKWNTARVMDMGGMFEGAESFNQDLSSWNIKNLKYKDKIFNDCAIKDEYRLVNKVYTPHTREELEQLIYVESLKNIDIIYINDLSELFKDSELDDFTGIESWNTENVTNMRAMFKNAKHFNQDIGSWDTSRVKDMSSMFEGAESFNQNIENFDVLGVINMSSIFKNAKAFNQPLNKWNVANAEDMSSMFEGAESFNQPLNNWKVEKVKDAYNIFKDAKKFNQDLSKWNLDSINLQNYMFANCPIKDEYQPAPSEEDENSFLLKIRGFFGKKTT